MELGDWGGVFLALQWSLRTNPRSHRSYTDLGTLKWQKSNFSFVANLTPITLIFTGPIIEQSFR